MSDWKPIGTAPRSERVLVLLKPQPFETAGEITFGWLAQSGDDWIWTRDETGESCEPTHWLRVPDRPAVGAAEA